MSDVSGGAGWWRASDGKWYPPERHADPEWRARHTSTEPTPPPTDPRPMPLPEPTPSAPDPRPMPLIDNTAVLHRALGLTDEQYLAFVARGYTPDPVPDLAALRAVVGARGPEAVAELEGVLTAHGRDLSTVA